MNSIKFFIDASWFKNNTHNIESETLWMLSHKIDDLFDEINDKAIGFLLNESNV